MCASGTIRKSRNLLFKIVIITQRNDEHLVTSKVMLHMFKVRNVTHADILKFNVYVGM